MYAIVTEFVRSLEDVQFLRLLHQQQQQHHRRLRDILRLSHGNALQIRSICVVCTRSIQKRAKHGKKEMREWREREKTDKQSSILFLWSIISLVSTSEKPLKAKTHSRCSVFFSLILSAPIVVVHFLQSVTIFNGRTRICSCIFFSGESALLKTAHDILIWC